MRLNVAFVVFLRVAFAKRHETNRTRGSEVNLIVFFNVIDGRITRKYVLTNIAIAIEKKKKQKQINTFIMFK